MDSRSDPSSNALLPQTRLAMLVDGTLLPSGEGATFRFLECARSLAFAGADVTLVHAYRGWSDWRRLSQETFRVILIHPDDYYSDCHVLRYLFAHLRPTHIQTKDPEVVASLVRRDLIPPSSRLLFECHDVRSAPLDAITDERFAASVSDRTICLTQKDADSLNESVGGARIAVIPCTISKEFVVAPRHQTAGNRLAFLGHFYYQPNADAVRWLQHELVPRLARTLPEVELRLIGAAPDALVAQCSTQGSIWVGYMDNMMEGLRTCDVGLSVLMSGRGFRVKTLAYMAAGLPVVANELGVAGIGVRSCFRVAETAATLAAHCAELLRSPRLRHLMAEEAQGILEREFGADRIARGYEGLLSDDTTRTAPVGRFHARWARYLDRYSRQQVVGAGLDTIGDRGPAWLKEMVNKGRFSRLMDEAVRPGHWVDLKDPRHLQAMRRLDRASKPCAS